MKTKKEKHLLILVPIVIGLVVGFSNCGQSFDTISSSTTTGGSNSAESGGSETTPPTTPPVTTPGGTTPVDNSPLVITGAYAVLTGDQTITSMLKTTGVKTASESVMFEYELRYSAFAGGSEINRITGPVLFASTSLAGEICNALIAKEKALPVDQRLFFGAISFPMGSAGISNSSYQTAIRGMARSFWTRNERSDELTAFQAFRNEFEGELTPAQKSQTASAENLMIATCAAVLSSLDAIVF